MLGSSSDRPRWMRVLAPFVILGLLNACSDSGGTGPGNDEGSWSITLSADTIAIPRVGESATLSASVTLSPPGRPERLAENLLRVLRDDAERLRLARAGHDFIRQFTWDRATDRMEAFLAAGAYTFLSSHPFFHTSDKCKCEHTGARSFRP